MSTLIGIGISKNPDPLLAGQEAALQAKHSLKQEEASLAVVFNSAELTGLSLLKGVRQVIGEKRIIGCSGAGVISHLGIEKRAVAVLLIASTDIKLQTSHINTLTVDDPYLLGQKFAEILSETQKSYLNKLCLYFCDGLSPNISPLTKGMQYRLGTSFPLIGVLAADNLHFKRTYQYCNQELLNAGAVGTILGGKLNFLLKTFHGWKPLGKPRLITKSKANIIQEIEHRPAIKIYEEYFAKSTEELKEKSTLQKISILYPLGIYLEGEKEYLLRNILAVEADGALVCQGDIPPEAEVRLMMSTRESATKAVEQAVLEIKEYFNNKNIYFALVFESIFRYKILGKSARLEREKIKQILPDTPFFGLYTFATIAPLESLQYRGQAYLHNQAISILAVGD
jgi:hypothetical protein